MTSRIPALQPRGLAQSQRRCGRRVEPYKRRHAWTLKPPAVLGRAEPVAHSQPIRYPSIWAPTGTGRVRTDQSVGTVCTAGVGAASGVVDEDSARRVAPCSSGAGISFGCASTRTRTVTRTVTSRATITTTATTTRTATVTRTRRITASPPSTTVQSPSADFDCKVLSFGPDDLEYEVTHERGRRLRWAYRRPLP